MKERTHSEDQRFLVGSFTWGGIFILRGGEGREMFLSRNVSDFYFLWERGEERGKTPEILPLLALSPHRIFYEYSKHRLCGYIKYSMNIHIV